MLNGRIALFAAVDTLVTTATEADKSNLVFVLSACVECVWLMRGYIFNLDGWTCLSPFVVSTGVPEGLTPPRTHTHTHTHTHMQSTLQLISALFSYVSYAVNQQACRPVAIPPDCQTQLAYLRTVCLCVIK